MTTTFNASAFFKICVGVTLVICSVSLLFFSVSFSVARAGEPGVSKPSGIKGYEPIGIQVDGRGYVTVYGYDGSETGNKIEVLAREKP